MSENLNGVHVVKIIDRQKIDISLVNEIVSSSEREVYIKLDFGMMQIVGEGLKIIKLVPEDKSLQIDGKIFGLNYINKVSKKTFLKKVFK